MDEQFPLALQPGTILAGQYSIEKVLGQGGFGITYSAIDHTNGQRVAIKEFFPDTLAYRERTTVISYPGERSENYQYGKTGFLEEARTLAEFIGNENIVRIYSYFEENDTAYFAMEFVEGVSFDKYLRDHGGKIPFDDAKRILVPIMDALAAVHSKGIVHRDVTPDNIYITNDNKIKLLDFGAARYSLGDKSRSLDVILKHGFAPKEQYTRRGKQGPFTDVYSLGATFYFALTGKRPPDAVDRIEEDELIPPSRLGAQLTEYEERAILQALQVQPGDRFQNMIAFKNVMLGENAPEPVFQPEPQQPNRIVFGAPGQPVPPAAPVPPVQAPVNQYTQQQFVQPPVQPPVDQYTQQQFPQQPADQYAQQMPEQPVQPVQPAQPVQPYPQQPVNQYPQASMEGAAYPAPQQKKSNGKIIGIIAGAVAIVGIGIAAAIIIPSLNSKVDTNNGGDSTTGTSVTTEVPEETTTTTTTTASATTPENTEPRTTARTLPPMGDITLPPDATAAPSTTKPTTTTAQPSNQNSDLTLLGNTVYNIAAGGIVAQVNDTLYKVTKTVSGYDNISRFNEDDNKWDAVVVGKDAGIKEISNLCAFENGALFLIADGYAGYASLDENGKYNVTKVQLNYHDGKIDRFYWTDSYMFVHYRNQDNDTGGWARIRISDSKIEEELPVKYNYHAVLLNGSFYYIADENGKSTIIKCAATDFSQRQRDVFLQDESAAWFTVVSDGTNIFTLRMDKDTSSTLYKLVRFDVDLTIDSAWQWELNNAMNDTDYVYIADLMVYKNRAFFLMVDKDWSKYGVCCGTFNDSQITFKKYYDGTGLKIWPMPCVLTTSTGFKAVFNVVENDKYLAKIITFNKN